METKKLVSAIIPSYNMGKYLPMAIESIINQTYQNVEIHVVDDGSTDDTKEIMKRYDGFENVFYHYQENKGCPGARNTGIRSANGDFFAFIDADDTWSEDKLEKQLAVFEADDEVGVVYTNYKLMDERGNLIEPPTRQHYSGYISNKLFVNNFVTGMTSMIRRECFDKVGVFDEELLLGEDYDLWLRLSPYFKFIFLDEVTYFYRQWGGQISHNQHKKYKFAEKIMSKFESEHSDILDRNVVSEGWANLLVSKAYMYFINENDRLGAVKCLFQALKHKPGYMPAWKGLVKLLINYKKE